MTSVIALIPAHNEAASIGATIEALLAQHRRPDQIVVIPNGCTDATATIAAGYPVTVLELPRLEHRKSEALNTAWSLYARAADVVLCIDADTILPSNAVGDWVAEMQADPGLAGSSSKFTMRGPEFLVRLQRAEFAKWTDASLRRGWTSVLAGTACAIRGSVLKEMAARADRQGPWTYASAVEDFELTYRIRQAGYRCQVSPTVRAYTDAMRSLPALWGQRMKWQAGTVEDLLAFGLNRHTALDWWQQAQGLLAAAVRIAWIAVTILLAVHGSLTYNPWWLLAPVLFIATDVKAALRIPHRDRADVLFAALLLPQEAFAWMRAAWFLTSWVDVLTTKITRGHKDRWATQYALEGN